MNLYNIDPKDGNRKKKLSKQNNADGYILLSVYRGAKKGYCSSLGNHSLGLELDLNFVSKQRYI